MYNSCIAALCLMHHNYYKHYPNNGAAFLRKRGRKIFTGNQRRKQIKLKYDMKRNINKESSKEEIIAYSRLYVRQVWWDDEDNCYIGSLPELCGNCCHGDDPREVYAQLDDIAMGYAEDKALGRGYYKVPEPGNLVMIQRSPYKDGGDVASDIAKLRHRIGLTQKAFAAILGVSGQTVNNWEKGRKKPDGASARLLQIAEKHPEAVLS